MNEAFHFEAAPRNAKIIVLCDHATNIVPDWIAGGNLGIERKDMERHIAYDIGALGVSRHLARAFGGALIASQFSRLVIDPNRGLDDPTLIMKVYDRTVIPANRDLSDEQKGERIDRLHKPYHAKIAEVIRTVREADVEPIIISMHSFTPQLRGRAPRPWHVGILSADDRRLAEPVIAAFQQRGEYTIGDNEPYHGALMGDTLDQHGIRQGIHHVLIEIRNDLIETEDQQKEWGKLCADVLAPVFEERGLL